MKKLNFSILFTIFFINIVLSQTQWNGANNTTGAIYRTGNVGIGINPVNLFQMSNGIFKVEKSISIGSADPTIFYVNSQEFNSQIGSGPSYAGRIGIGTSAPISDFHIQKKVTIINNSYQGINRPTLYVNTGQTSSSYGKIGIGTSNPHSTLEIMSNSPNNSDKNYMLTLSNIYSVSGSHTPTIQFNNGGFTNGIANVYWNVGATVSGTSKFAISYKENGYIPTETEYLSINKSGQVGINIKSDINNDFVNDGNYKLVVNGKIMCEELKVQMSTNWPDFVFDKSYSRMSLHDLEIYINKNKHLPSVPSTSEIEKSGMSVGEMNALLLQKIEELTLYIIELNNKINLIENVSK